jgi:hypothetical protein
MYYCGVVDGCSLTHDLPLSRRDGCMYVQAGLLLPGAVRLDMRQYVQSADLVRLATPFFFC